MKGRSIYARSLHSPVNFTFVYATRRRNNGENSAKKDVSAADKGPPPRVVHHPSHTVPGEMNPAEQRAGAQSAITVHQRGQIRTPPTFVTDQTFCWAAREKVALSYLWQLMSPNRKLCFFFRPAALHVFAALIKCKYYAWVCEKWRLMIMIIRLRQVYLSFSIQQCEQRTKNSLQAAQHSRE